MKSDYSPFSHAFLSGQICWNEYKRPKLSLISKRGLAIAAFYLYASKFFASVPFDFIVFPHGPYIYMLFFVPKILFKVLTNYL